MKTKVLPFVPSVTDVNPAQAASSQLQELVDEMAADGWNFISLTSMRTTVSSTGCGSANKPKELVNYQLVVFQK